ncbi:MAG: hypothetical protein J6G98_00675 [Bacilli bacterium]|nr:hypothetical protein [Bacilli bacterium]
MEYKELINIVENKRNDLYRKYKKSYFFKKVYKIYINKYDELLLDLYMKYENNLTRNK